MKPVETLLTLLGDHRIPLRSEGVRLVVKAPKGAKAQERATAVRYRKGELRQFLCCSEKNLSLVSTRLVKAFTPWEHPI